MIISLLTNYINTCRERQEVPMKIFTAFLFAFLTGPLLGSIAGSAIAYAILPESSEPAVWTILFIAAFGAPFAYAATLVFGLPLLYLCEKYHYKSPYLFLAVGFLLGPIVSFTIFQSPADFASNFFGICFGVPCAFITAFIYFRLRARIEKPPQSKAANLHPSPAKW